MPNGIRKKAHREDEAIRSYAAALRLFRNVRRKNDKRGRTDAKRIKVYVGLGRSALIVRAGKTHKIKSGCLLNVTEIRTSEIEARAIR